ncbi:MAG: nitrous oxide reductase accessory protein NosL [Deltaproteobacteria bacterium]|nr:nitrous oxide reductase accessory protein NosL [Deltaproteobacteria bacterium]
MNKNLFRTFLIIIPFLFLSSAVFTGCSPNKAKLPPPRKVTSTTTSKLCGMFLKQYPGPEAQVIYRNGKTYFFCDTVELFEWIHLKSIAVRVPLVMYVQDMTHNSWKHPEDRFINAEKAYYVAGSKRMGCMGPTFVSFSNEKAANKFIKKYGGKIYKFNEITVEMINKAANPAGMKMKFKNMR